MALTLFEDFEDGTVDALYVGKTGDSWEVQANNRTTGFGQPRYRPSPDSTFFIQAPTGVSGDQALAFVGNSAFALSVEHTISDGLGGYFFSNAAGAGGGTVSSSEVTIGWGNLYGDSGGTLSVDRVGDTLTITETYADDVDSFTQDQEVVVTDFLPVEGVETDTGLWLEVRWHRPDGWVVRNATSGATIASGAYPWTIPATGLVWSLNLFPNAFGPSGLSGSARVVVDDLYGYPGRDRSQAVRQYPRDDELGYSAGRRLYPPPRLARIIGAQT